MFNGNNQTLLPTIDQLFINSPPRVSYKYGELQPSSQKNLSKTIDYRKNDQLKYSNDMNMVESTADSSRPPINPMSNSRNGHDSYEKSSIGYSNNLRPQGSSNLMKQQRENSQQVMQNQPENHHSSDNLRVQDSLDIMVIQMLFKYRLIKVRVMQSFLIEIMEVEGIKRLMIMKIINREIIVQ